MERLQPGRARGERGFTLIEVLVSIVVFSLAVLAMVGLQASAIQLTTDAQQRAEATFLADQLLGRILISDPTTATTFSHHADGNVDCAPTGAASTNPVVTEWLTEVAGTLPRAVANEQQIVVTGSGSSTEVTVKLCWRNQDGDTPHKLTVTNRPQWQ